MSARLKVLISGALGAALAACASAPVQTPGSTEKLTAAMQGQIASDGTVISCRSIELTGTRFPAKECKSQKTWDEFDAMMALNAKEQTDKFQRVNSGCSTTGTCP